MSAQRMSIRLGKVDSDTKDPDQAKEKQDKQKADAPSATPTYNRLDPSNPG